MPEIMKIALLEELTDPVDNCWIPIVDISEPVEANQTKKIAVQNVKSELTELLAAVYPVGSIYVSALSTNPATLFGFGTWAAFGAGRMPVGYDAAQTEFNAGLKTGGAKTHTLVTAEMPVHTHVQNAHTHTQTAHDHDMGQLWHVPSGTSAWVIASSGTVPTESVAAVNQSTTPTNQNTGSGSAHNNLPPYITVYMWRRTD